MSRWIRPLHKFGTKPAYSKNFPINPVEWLPKKGVMYIPVKQQGSQVWEIYAQREITINRKETETLELGLGVRMTRGWCQVSLSQEIRASGCGLRDDVVSKNAEDIVITILNDSDSEVTVNEGDLLCFVRHTQRIRTYNLKKLYCGIKNMPQGNTTIVMKTDVADRGAHVYRLAKISEIQKEIERERDKRAGLNKKYRKGVRFINVVDGISDLVVLGSSASAIAAMSTIVAAPIAVALQVLAVGACVFSVSVAWLTESHAKGGEA